MAKSNKELIEYVSSHSAVVSKLFDKFIIELAKAGIPYDQLPDDKVFKLSDYPESAKNASRLADKMRKALKDELIKSIDGAISLAMDITSAEFKPYTRLKDDALQSFRDAVTATYTDTRINTSKGLSLSNRVWNYTEQTKSEFELAMSQILEDGLSKGTSAEEIGRKIRSKLRNPDMMYRRYHTKKIQSNGLKVDVVEWRRRVVDSEGNVHFVKEDLAKVGRGVYRSARQNALRMAATEVNMAYQYAENMRYQKEPFVLGYRINLSTNHTCKDKDGVPRPFHDMCDELEGDYPKWFLWRSWHPRCRCYMTAIRCSKEEMRKIAKLPQDEYERYVSPNAIRNMPDCYNQYIENNRDRIEASIERGTQPYWIQDNYVDGDINGGFVKKTAPEEIIPTPQEATPEQRAAEIAFIAAKRHAERDNEAILAKWRESRIIARGQKLVELASEYNVYYPTELKYAIKAKYAPTVESMGKKLARDIAIEKMVTPKELYRSRLRELYSDEEIKQAFNEAYVSIHKLKDVCTKEMYDLFASQFSKNDDNISQIKSLIFTKEANRKKIEIKLENLKSRVKDGESIIARAGVPYTPTLTGNEDILSIARLEYKVKELEKASQIMSQVGDIIDFAKNSKSKSLASLVAQINDEIAKNGYKTDISSLVKDAKAKIAQISKDREYRNQKNRGNVYGFRPGETATQLVERLGNKCPKTLRDLDYHIRDYEDYLDHTPEANEQIELVKKLFEKFDFGMNIHAEYLENCMDEHFKNQFETGTSEGALFDSNNKGDIDTNNARLIASYNFFGYDGIKNKCRPDYEKYGALLDTNIKYSLHYSKTNWYGEVEVRFKKDKVLCTWTANDSLHIDFQPSLVSDPKLCSFGRNHKMVENIKSIDSMSKVIADMSTSYIELQYHGLLDFSCVESVTFPDYAIFSKYERLVPRMKKEFGVKVFYLDTKKDELIEV